MKERPRLQQPLAGVDPAGVEHQRLERLVGRRDVRVEHLGVEVGVGGGTSELRIERGQNLGADRTQHGCRRARQAATGRRSQQHRP
jgi:hypothetical protein